MTQAWVLKCGKRIAKNHLIVRHQTIQAQHEYEGQHTVHVLYIKIDILTQMKLKRARQKETFFFGF